MAKKLRVMILLGVLVILAQGAFAWEIPNGLPSYIVQSLEDAPKDDLVSIGFSEITDSIALGNAMGDILDKCYGMIQQIVRDYTFSNEVDFEAALSYQENITIAFSGSQLNGLTINTMSRDFSSTAEFTGLTVSHTEYWAIVILNKSSLLDTINTAARSAKDTVPAMAALDFETGIDLEYDRLISQELRILNYDNDIRTLLISESPEN